MQITPLFLNPLKPKHLKHCSANNVAPTADLRDRRKRGMLLGWMRNRENIFTF